MNLDILIHFDRKLENMMVSGHSNMCNFRLVYGLGYEHWSLASFLLVKSSVSRAAYLTLIVFCLSNIMLTKRLNGPIVHMSTLEGFILKIWIQKESRIVARDCHAQHAEQVYVQRKQPLQGGPERETCFQKVLEY